MKKRLRRILVVVAVLTGAAAGGSALVNLNLPTHSMVTGRLSVVEKARLSEATHLRQSLGDTVWPGWGSLDVPIIVHNEAYAFLVAER